MVVTMILSHSLFCIHFTCFKSEPHIFTFLKLKYVYKRIQLYTSKKHLNDADEKQSAKTKIKEQCFSLGNMNLRDFNKS